MLKDMRGTVAPDLAVFETMDESYIEFALGGSRYMGCERPDSDWDFITDDNETTREFLKDLGFTENILPDDEKYNIQAHGSNTAAVAQRVIGDVKVQVQLCHDGRLQRACRDVIHQHLLRDHIAASREERMHLWNDLGRVLSFTANKYEALPF